MKHANYARTRATTLQRAGKLPLIRWGLTAPPSSTNQLKHFKMKGFIIAFEVAIALFFIIIAVISVYSMSTKDDQVIDRIMQAYTALFILVSGAIIILCVHIAAGQL